MDDQDRDVGQLDSHHSRFPNKYRLVLDPLLTHHVD